MRTLKKSHCGRLTRLAAACAVLTALPAHAVVTVGNCKDSGVGSLRQAVLNAPEGGTIDMTGLLTPPVDPSCSTSTITLETGSIVVTQNSLTIDGPGMDKLTIASDLAAPLHALRSFEHAGDGVSKSGTLTVSNLSLRGGFVYSSTASVAGGCIYSKENVSLTNVRVSDCIAHVRGANYAEGGGIAVVHNLKLRGSIVSGNQAVGLTSGSGGSVAIGGGIAAAGNIYAFQSTISGNYATGPTLASPIGVGGGLYAHGGVNIRYSTISGNVAGKGIGGFFVNGGYQAEFVGSTISGNAAPYGVIGGGAIANTSNVYFYNSTLAFNTAAAASYGASVYAAGLAVKGVGVSSGKTVPVILTSTIMSNNTYADPPVGYDFSISAAQGPVSVSGSKNLVLHSSASLPTNTQHGCPLLGPLRDNGGPTFTHALLSRSPAIDNGFSSFAGNDQRGTGFMRESPTGYPDIGAYEVQKTDIVFNAGFDGCP
jgi:hypothetical protein